MPSEQRAEQPQAIVITTDEADATLNTTMTALGLHVSVTHSLLDGYTQAYQLLASTPANQRVAILVDLTLTEPGFPALSGTVLSAALTRHMRLREIRPAWLIGLTTRPTLEQTTEARIAGCLHMVRKPCTDESLALLRELAARPAPVPYRTITPAPTTQAVIAFQTMAHRMLTMVQAAQVHTWTPEEVTLLLRWLTPYPVTARSSPQAISSTEAAQAEALLRGLGGLQAARQRLETVAAQLEPHYPLHGEILRKLLAGWERRAIVRYFVDQRLYEDSRIYDCIKELPARIGEQLRRAHAAPQANLRST